MAGCTHELEIMSDSLRKDTVSPRATSGSRKRNTLDDTYVLPADEEEFMRLQGQHTALRLAMGLYPCPEVVEPILESRRGGTKRVLDVGCGSGTWVLDMAQQFPNASILGIDLALPNLDPSTLPPNVSFKTQNITQDLSEYYDQFDVIHMRLVGPFQDLDGTYASLERCLKPGGVFIAIHVDREFQDDNWVKTKLRALEGDEDVSGVSEEGSWFQRMHWEMTQTMPLSGVDISGYSEFKDKGLWDQPLLDPETAVSASCFIPVGKWAKANDPEGTRLLQTVGELMRQSVSSVHRAWHPVLLKHGIPQETLDEWSRNAQQDLDTTRVPFSLRLSMCWARRRAGTGLAAPPLPRQQKANKQTRKSQRRFEYPFFETYRNPQEAAAARSRRRATMGQLPTAAVVRAYRSRYG